MKDNFTAYPTSTIVTLTFWSQNFIYICLVVLDVMVTNQPSEVTTKFFYTSHDDATTGVDGKLLKMML